MYLCFFNYAGYLFGVEKHVYRIYNVHSNQSSMENYFFVTWRAIQNQTKIYRRSVAVYNILNLIKIRLIHKEFNSNISYPDIGVNEKNITINKGVCLNFLAKKFRNTKKKSLNSILRCRGPPNGIWLDRRTWHITARGLFIPNHHFATRSTNGRLPYNNQVRHFLLGHDSGTEQQMVLTPLSCIPPTVYAHYVHTY